MTEIGERIDGRIRDLADLCTRNGTPCADGLLAEIGQLRADNARRRAMWQANCKDNASVVDALRLELAATEGDLGVAIREAAAARETLQAMRPLLAHVNDSVPTIGIPAALTILDAALDQRLVPWRDKMSGDSQIIGYVLIDPNTNAIDWDGIVHSARDGAIREALRALHLDDGETERPCCGADIWYEVAEVRRVPKLNSAVLAAAQDQWDGHRAAGNIDQGLAQ